MVMAVKAIGIVILLIGVVFMIMPKAMRSCMSFWTRGWNALLGALINVPLGAFLLYAASECRVMWFVATIGIIAIVKGVLIVVLGPARVSKAAVAWTTRKDFVLRLIAVMPIAFGILLIFAA
ncbi:MAG: hypothetical protein HQ558_06875 [Candidatus Omnitrophica bacterium]|nr:hypothetical protein [Candidatus Omnitrophota bacterium]